MDADPTILMALSSIARQQANPTKQTYYQVKHFLKYMESHSKTTIFRIIQTRCCCLYVVWGRFEYTSVLSIVWSPLVVSQRFQYSLKFSKVNSMCILVLFSTCLVYSHISAVLWLSALQNRQNIYMWSRILVHVLTWHFLQGYWVCLASN